MKEKPRTHKLVDLYGRKATVTAGRDHPQVKRFGLSHRFAKGFYLSVSAGSVNTAKAFPREVMYVADYGNKLSAMPEIEVGRWLPNLSAGPA